jgi:ribosome maturation factor RimP
MIEPSRIEQLINQYLGQGELFLVDVRIKPGNTIMVFIDSDKEVAISDCIRISRFIEANLNREEEDYELRVSSAGIDHPYVFLRQYLKNINRMVQVTLNDGNVISGMLVAANEQSIEVRPQEKKTKKKQGEEPAQHIEFEQIKETKGLITL